MKISITHAPDFDGISHVYQSEIGKGLVDVARFVIRDATSRIEKRLTPSGGRQRPNSPAYAEWKYRHYGWRTPLKKDQILNDSAAYRINGKPPGSESISVWTSAGKTEVIAQLPNERGEIVQYLRGLGYSYWELSEEDKTYERSRMAEALRLARQAVAQLRANARRR